MKRHIQVAMLGLVVLALGLIAACGGSPIPDDVEWSVVDTEKFPRGATTVVNIRVTLNKEVDESALQAVADKLRAGDAMVVVTSRDELTVWFYLPGMDPMSAAWATVFYNDPIHGNKVVIPGS